MRLSAVNIAYDILKEDNNSDNISKSIICNKKNLFANKDTKKGTMHSKNLKRKIFIRKISKFATKKLLILKKFCFSIFFLLTNSN